MLRPQYNRSDFGENCLIAFDMTSASIVYLPLVNSNNCDRSLPISESRSSKADLEFASTPAQISSALNRSSFSAVSLAATLLSSKGTLEGVA
mmetsp:Transcript_18810/g.40338  ORF Transcript_18810/g.40338 Transcript_18810/m.40338 type:complete len:92 (-) Transcript_18810:2241-2516(-)